MNKIIAAAVFAAVSFASVAHADALTMTFKGGCIKANQGTGSCTIKVGGGSAGDTVRIQKASSINGNYSDLSSRNLTIGEDGTVTKRILNTANCYRIKPISSSSTRSRAQCVK